MGPLKGIRIIELGAIGPVPFCAMMLSDMGGEVIRVERESAAPGQPAPVDCTLRGRRSIALDLKNAAGVDALLTLVAGADVLLEGFRPGVAERLGIGPETCLARNPRLIYGRMTGWGQTGPLAAFAGRDINYISLTGALHLVGEAGRRPVPPLNMVGDMGGGGMLLLAGVLAALVEAVRSGTGQVVDAAMIDGATALMAYLHNLRATDPEFRDETGGSVLAGAAPNYRTYETRDGKYVAVGALDPRSFAMLVDALGLDPQSLPNDPLLDRKHWPLVEAAIAGAIQRKSRDEWAALLEATDCCLSPVLTLDEAPSHPHNQARQTLTSVDGVIQSAPAPRFSRSGSAALRPPRSPGVDTQEVLREAGLTDERLAALRAAGALS